MAKHHRKRRTKSARRSRRAAAAAAAGPAPLPEAYCRACRLAADDNHDEARRLYAELKTAAAEPRLPALIVNDLSPLDALAGPIASAHPGQAAPLRLHYRSQTATPSPY